MFFVFFNPTLRDVEQTEPLQAPPHPLLACLMCDLEDDLLGRILSFQKPFLVDKAECHAVLDSMDLTWNGQPNL